MALLPTELVIKTARYLDDKAKYDLIRVCRHLHAIVQPLLYENIDTRSFLPPVQLKRNTHIFHTLATRPDLAEAVISFSADIYKGTAFYQSPRGISRLWNLWTQTSLLSKIERSEAELLKDLVTMFNSAKNIRSLNLRFIGIDISKTVALYSPMSRAIEAMDLRSLTIHPNFWPNDIIPALRSHPNLKHLAFVGTFPDVSAILPTDLPHLASLTCSLDQARHLVPGRPVTILNMTSSRDPPLGLRDEAFQRLGLSTGPLKEITLWRRWPVEDDAFERDVSHVLSYISSLEALCLLSEVDYSYLHPKMVCARHSPKYVCVG